MLQLYATIPLPQIKPAKSGVRERKRLINGVAIYQENLFDLRANGTENFPAELTGTVLVCPSGCKPEGGTEGISVWVQFSAPPKQAQKLHAH